MRDYTLDVCRCDCKASLDLAVSIHTNLEALIEHLGKTVSALERTYDELSAQLEVREKSEEYSEIVSDMDREDLGYDVFSRIDPGQVKYDQGFLGEKCYNAPTIEDREKGVCGDSVESVTVYTVQIAAASLATVLTGGAGAKLVEYAMKFFPMIFETGVVYNLTETLIDDGNRVILDNMAGEGSELYTYSPFQFEIYRDHEFSIGTASFNRVIVYINLDAIDRDYTKALQKIIDGLVDDSCEDEGC
jgi:hypothetical protein